MDEGPLLVELDLAGGSDRRALSEEIRAIHRRVEAHSRLDFVEGAGHDTIPQTESDLYWRSVNDFIHPAREPGVLGGLVGRRRDPMPRSR